MSAGMPDLATRRNCDGSPEVPPHKAARVAANAAQRRLRLDFGLPRPPSGGYHSQVIRSAMGPCALA